MKKHIRKYKLNSHDIEGKCLDNVETAVANKRPQSAMTVNVSGIPINAKNMQKIRPPRVTGTMLPYPVKKDLWFYYLCYWREI